MRANPIPRDRGLSTFPYGRVIIKLCTLLHEPKRARSGVCPEAAPPGGHGCCSLTCARPGARRNSRRSDGVMMRRADALGVDSRAGVGRQ